MRGTIQDRWWSTGADGTRTKTVRYRQGLRYRAIYRGHDGRQHSKSFSRKSGEQTGGEQTAEQWLRAELSKIDGGAWTDPRAGQRRYGDWASEWMNGLDVKPKTRAGYESLLRSRVLPTFAAVPLSKISGPMARRWVAAMVEEGLSASRIRQARQLVGASLEAAVADGVLGKNPIAHVKVPADRPRVQRFLDIDQVQRLAAAADDQQKGAGALVMFLAVSGLRWGEAAALKRSALDLMRRRVVVRESATEISGRLVIGTPKTHRMREVALPRFVVSMLTEHCAGVGVDDLVFTAPKGGYLRSANFRRKVWKPALAAAGLDPELRIHDLRSTTASMLISSGASVKVVQRALGHASAAVTLNVYSGLFESDLDSAADALDQRFSVTNVAPALPEPVAEVRELRQKAL